MSGLTEAADMPAFDKAKIQALLQTVDNSVHNQAKGKAFEELACHIFSCVPGITNVSFNEMNTFATEEIDVACWNEQDVAGLRSFNACFLVECKGWSDPVSSMEVAWFLTKIEHRGLDFG